MNDENLSQSFADACKKADGIAPSRPSRLFYDTLQACEKASVPWADPDMSLLDDRRGQLPDFPIDALSSACRDWGTRAAHGAGVTAAHVAVPLIGIVSSLIGTARRVQASRSFIQPMTTWTAIVGFSGSGKTPGIDATKRALANGSGPAVKAVASLEVGDTITFVITIAGSGWTLTSGNVVTSSATVSYTVTGSNDDTTLLETLGAGTSVAATCVGGDARLRSFERVVTRIEALASGDAISGAAGGAVADGFSDNGGALITQTSGGLHVNFAAEPNQTPHDGSSAFDAVISARESVQLGSGLRNDLNGPSSLAQPWRNSGRADDTPGVLGYASNSGPTKAPALVVAPPKDWQVWADVRGTGWNTNVSAGDIVGGQVNALLGVTRRLTQDFLVGVLGGYETFDYSSNTLDRRLKGDGWTAGGYLGWRLWPGLRFEASVARSGVSYHGFAGADAFGPAASATFPGNRWVASTGLTGTYNVARLQIESHRLRSTRCGSATASLSRVAARC